MYELYLVVSWVLVISLITIGIILFIRRSEPSRVRAISVYHKYCNKETHTRPDNSTYTSHVLKDKYEDGSNKPKNIDFKGKRKSNRWKKIEKRSKFKSDSTKPIKNKKNTKRSKKNRVKNKLL